MQKQNIFLIALVLTAAGIFLRSEVSEIDTFSLWKTKFSKTYGSNAQDFYRRKIFDENVAQINAHNADASKTYKMAVNLFADLSQQQFSELYLSSTIFPVRNNEVQPEERQSYVHRLGDIDWAAQGAVTPVKRQGPCGSCWAFSTVGTLESLSKINGGTLTAFSQQQLVDCSQKYGNFGCNGGWMTNSFKFVIDQGICQESEYPYVGHLQQCKKETGGFKISGYSEGKNCQQLSNLLAKGTVAVGVNAYQWPFYSEGIFNQCTSTTINFAVVLVGATDKYWKLKNAWSDGWGERGYIRLAPGNTCGICQMASIPYK